MNIHPVILFAAIVLSVVAFLFINVVKDFHGFKMSPKLKNVPGGIIMVLSLVIIVAATMYSCRTKAGELQTFKYAGMFVGLDYDKNSLFCRKPVPTIVSDDKWTSNVGFKLNLLYAKETNILFTGDLIYQHHSCAFNQDKPTYDAPGLNFELLYFFGE